jgi:CDP-diacylglycerol--serine O-phosphatidyltransferase
MLTICTVLYLASLPAGWKSYRDHARNAAAQAAPSTPAETSPSTVVPFGQASEPADTDRAARLN